MRRRSFLCVPGADERKLAKAAALSLAGAGGATAGADEIVRMVDAAAGLAARRVLGRIGRAA